MTTLDPLAEALRTLIADEEQLRTGLRAHAITVADAIENAGMEGAYIQVYMDAVSAADAAPESDAMRDARAALADHDAMFDWTTFQRRYRASTVLPIEPCPWALRGSQDCAQYGPLDCDGARCADTENGDKT